MFTTFTSLHNVHLIITTTTKTNKTQQESEISLLITRESALLVMETKFHIGEDSGQGFTQIISQLG